MRTLLIDADIIAYQFAAKAQKATDWGDGDVSTQVEDLADVTPRVDDKLEELKAWLDADALVICLSCPTEEGFRRKLLPTYKGSRGPKPVLLGPIKDYLQRSYKSYLKPTLEADDVMGILSTHPTLILGQKVIVSIDKDMKTIPGWLFNPDKDKAARFISGPEADYWHLYQTLVGDTTDEYKGCPGIGPKKADEILKGSEIGREWPEVLAAFEAKKLTEEDALVQARVARILRHTDYDFKRKEVILWTPSDG